MDILGARVSTAGAVLDAIPQAVSTAAGKQSDPAIASGAGGFFAAWTDERNDSSSNIGPDVYGTRLSGNGSVLDPAGIVISALVDQGIYAYRGESSPCVAFGGTTWFVGWRDTRLGSGGDAIFAARVSTAGGLLDPAGIQVVGKGSDWKTTLAMDWDGSKMGFAWSQQLDYAIQAARLNANGSLADTTPLSLLTGQDHLWGFAFNGTRLVALWT